MQKSICSFAKRMFVLPFLNLGRKKKDICLLKCCRIYLIFDYVLTLALAPWSALQNLSFNMAKLKSCVEVDAVKQPWLYILVLIGVIAVNSFLTHIPFHPNPLPTDKRVSMSFCLRRYFSRLQAASMKIYVCRALCIYTFFLTHPK